MISMATLQHLLISYGYLTVWLVVALESMGIPAPGETILLIVAVAAGTTHQLSLPLPSTVRVEERSTVPSQLMEPDKPLPAGKRLRPIHASTVGNERGASATQ